MRARKEDLVPLPIPGGQEDSYNNEDIRRFWSLSLSLEGRRTAVTMGAHDWSGGQKRRAEGLQLKTGGWLELH